MSVSVFQDLTRPLGAHGSSFRGNSRKDSRDKTSYQIKTLLGKAATDYAVFSEYIYISFEDFKI